MADNFTECVLKIVVAQICQNIGWHGINTFPLEILTDVLRRYLLEIGLLNHRYCEHAGRTQVNLEDFKLTFRDLSINISELEEYVNNVEPVPFVVDIPQFPVWRESNLNFLKPGSSEVLYRPLHVSEHLPPMYPEMEDSEISKANGTYNEMSPYRENSPVSSPASTFRKPSDVFSSDSPPNKKLKLHNDEEGRPVREILSVMMTSNGYLSPAREGKLPDKKMCNDDFSDTDTENEPMEENTVLPPEKPKKITVGRKPCDVIKKSQNKETDSVLKVENETCIDKETPKLAVVKETSKLKMFKLGSKNSKSSNSSKTKAASHQINSSSKCVKPSSPKHKVCKSPVIPKVDKPIIPSEPKVTPVSKDSVVKLPLFDPDKQKLNIFKKMIAGKVKDERERKESIDHSKDSILSTKSDVDDIIEEVVKKSSLLTEKDKKKDKKERKEKKKCESNSVEKTDFSDKATDKVKFEKDETKELSAKQSQEIDDTISAVIDMAKSPEPCAVVEDDFSFASPPRTPTTPRTPELIPVKTFPKSEKSTEKKKKEKKDGVERAKSRKSKSPKKLSRDDVILDRPNTPELDRDIKNESEPLDMSKPNTFSKTSGFNPNINPVFGKLPSFPYNFPGGSPSFPFPSTSLMPTFPSFKSDSPEDKTVNRTSDKKPDKLDSGSEISPHDKPEKLKPARKEKKENTDEKFKKKKKDKIEKVTKEKKLKEEKTVKQDKSDGSSLPKITLKFGAQTPSPSDSLSVYSDGVPSPQIPSLPQDSPKLVAKPGKKTKEDKVEDKKKEKLKDKDKDSSSKDKVKKKDKLETNIPVEDINPLGSPELAKFSPLTTMKPKVKETECDKGFKSDEDRKKKLSFGKSKKPGIKNKKVEDMVLITETVGSYIDESGNKVWICPSCGKQDDGSPMIGCDDCDDWHHWVCVGIQVPPDEHENWYCKRCIVKKQGGGANSTSQFKKGRKKNKMK